MSNKVVLDLEGIDVTRVGGSPARANPEGVESPSGQSESAAIAKYKAKRTTKQLLMLATVHLRMAAEADNIDDLLKHIGLVGDYVKQARESA